MDFPGIRSMAIITTHLISHPEIKFIEEGIVSEDIVDFPVSTYLMTKHNNSNILSATQINRQGFYKHETFDSIFLFKRKQKTLQENNDPLFMQRRF